MAVEGQRCGGLFRLANFQQQFPQQVQQTHRDLFGNGGTRLGQFITVGGHGDDPVAVAWGQLSAS